jgi:hypothetical protein
MKTGVYPTKKRVCLSERRKKSFSPQISRFGSSFENAGNRAVDIGVVRRVSIDEKIIATE